MKPFPSASTDALPPLRFRNTLGLLGGEGYDAIAPDWIGHGDSSMPEAGFDCSEGAYLKAIGQFVEAVGIKQPLALVVHVREGYRGACT